MKKKQNEKAKKEKKYANLQVGSKKIAHITLPAKLSTNYHPHIQAQQPCKADNAP